MKEEVTKKFITIQILSENSILFHLNNSVNKKNHIVVIEKLLIKFIHISHFIFYFYEKFCNIL